LAAMSLNGCDMALRIPLRARGFGHAWPCAYSLVSALVNSNASTPAESMSKAKSAAGEAVEQPRRRTRRQPKSSK
jgi:hypothetical protein